MASLKYENIMEHHWGEGIDNIDLHNVRDDRYAYLYMNMLGNGLYWLATVSRVGPTVTYFKASQPYYSTRA